jgi:GNAT superfamily N-acetyltransferase
LIEIGYLVDHPETIPILTRWFRAQWPAYYAERSPAEVAQDFYSEANRNKLPVRLVAFAEGTLAGTITLRELALRVMPEYHPGLGGLFVVASQRGRGIGSKLVSAGMDLAREQGYERIYTATVTASSILVRLGWKIVQAVSLDDEETVLYRCELEKSSSLKALNAKKNAQNDLRIPPANQVE